jgi:hypothetical protein
MKIRLNSGVTYQSRANIFPPVRKNQKKDKIFQQKDSMYDKIHEHFNKFDLLKLNFFGDDFENYGNITLKGISYPPKKIKIDYITKRANEEEIKNNNKIFNFEDDDIFEDTKLELFNTPKRKYNNFNFIYFRKINLPSLKPSKNKSMENINTNKLNKLQNKRLEKKPNKINSNQKQNNIRLNKNNSYNEGIKKLLKNKKAKSYNKLNKERLLPLIHNNISVTSRNVKLFLQTNKLEVKTNKNIKNYILKRNSFLKRYDNTADLNNKLNELKNDITKVNGLISKVVNKNDEDIPQFNMRFNHLFSKFHN